MRRPYRKRLPRRDVHRRIDVYVGAVVDGVAATARRRRLAPATVRNWVRWVERVRERAGAGRRSR
jgi:hypothetical protein